MRPPSAFSYPLNARDLSALGYGYEQGEALVRAPLGAELIEEVLRQQERQGLGVPPLAGAIPDPGAQSQPTPSDGPPIVVPPLAEPTEPASPTPISTQTPTPSATPPPVLPTLPPVEPTLPPILPTLPPLPTATLPPLPTATLPPLPTATLPSILPTLPPILPTLPPISPTLTLPPVLP